MNPIHLNRPSCAAACAGKHSDEPRSAQGAPEQADGRNDGPCTGPYGVVAPIGEADPQCDAAHAGPCLRQASEALWGGAPRHMQAAASAGTAVAADFRGACLDKARFAGAALYAADFSGARLRDADFRGARLVAVRFRGADLSRADLRELDTPWADFSGSVLRGAAISFGPRTLARLGDMTFLSAVVQSTASIADEYREVRAPMMRQIVDALHARMDSATPLPAAVRRLIGVHPLFFNDPAAYPLRC